MKPSRTIADPGSAGAIRQPLKAETRLIHLGRAPHEAHGAVNPPIYRASTILQPTLQAWEESRRPGYTGYRYGRRETPTARAFQTAMAQLYGADQCVAVCSGVAAITISILALTRAGDHVLVADSAFEPTRAFCEQVLTRFGVRVEFYDPRVGEGILELFRSDTRLVVAESPGSLTFEMQDLPRIVAAARARRARVVVDNTWATALYHNPFEYGADVVVEATTKYAAGHSDVMLGVILGAGELGEQLYATAKLMGMCAGSEELYLAQRGLRTMAIRLERSGATGLRVAEWLAARPEVARVLHPALPSDPGHALWRRDYSGCSGLFSILLRPVSQPMLTAFYNSLTLFGIGASWGGYESLIMPAQPAQLRSVVAWTEAGPLIRLYTGLEHPDDLIADLAAAFERMSAHVNPA